MEALSLSGYAVILTALSIGLWTLTVFSRHMYSAFYGPLSGIPGPVWRHMSIVPHLYSMWIGRETVDVLELHEKYGSIVRLAPDLVAMLGEGDLWKEIYASKSKGVCTFRKDILFYDVPINNIPGPVSAQDEAAGRMRKTMAPAFSDSGLRQHESRFKGWCQALTNRLSMHADEKIPTDMVKMFNCTTFDVMSDMLLSEPFHMLEKGEYAPLVPIAGDVHDITWIPRGHISRIRVKYANADLLTRYLSRRYGPKARGLIMRIPKINRIANGHHHFVTNRVDERLEKTPEKPDIWSLVTAETTTASLISQEERYSIANELMIAGTETSATALSGILYYLLRNPKWLAELSNHLRSQFNDIESLTMSALQGDKLLNAIIKESIRMYPPVPVGFPRHVPAEGCDFKGYNFPQGSRVAIYQHATYRSESRWHKPAEYHPERWMGEDERFKNDRFDAFEPFSVGLRACSAQNFAWHEIRLVLASVLINFDFELRPESINWSDQKTYIVWEKKPLNVNIKKRVMA